MYVLTTLIPVPGLRWSVRTGGSINPSKGQGPTQAVHFLGFTCHLVSTNIRIQVTDATVKLKRRAYVKNVAKVVGKIMACSRALSQVMQIILLDV